MAKLRDYIIQLNSRDTTYDLYDQRIGYIDKLDTENIDKIIVVSRNEDDGEVSLIGKSPKEISGLTNVDDTSDLDKPISTQTQSALDLKIDKVEGMGLSHNDFTDDYLKQIESNTKLRHEHDNKELLDSYTQTDADIKDCIAKEHAHANKGTLDNLDESLADRFVVDTISSSTYDIPTNLLLSDELAKKENKLTWDDMPKKDSINPVKSDGIFSEIEKKQDTITVQGLLKGNNNGTYNSNVELAIPGKDYIYSTTDKVDYNNQSVLVRTKENSSGDSYAWADIPIINTYQSHNSIYRGKDLTEKYTYEEIGLKLRENDWSDMYIGDFININGVDWLFGGFNYFLNNGNGNPTTKNHIVMIPRNCIAKAPMNSSYSTLGGYTNAEIRRRLSKNGDISTSVYIPIGDALVLPHSRYLSNGINAYGTSMVGRGFIGYSSSASWTETSVISGEVTVTSSNSFFELLSESMVFGTRSCCSSDLDNADTNTQLPIFQLNPALKIATYEDVRINYFLSDVSTANYFAGVNGSGHTEMLSADKEYGIRPYFLYTYNK